MTFGKKTDDGHLPQEEGGLEYLEKPPSNRPENWYHI